MADRRKEWDKEFARARKALERDNFVLDRKRIGYIHIYTHPKHPGAHISFYDSSGGWSTDAPAQVGMMAGHYPAGRMATDEDKALFDRASGVLRRAGVQVKGTSPYSKVLATAVRVVAALVARGEEDLAEQLVQVLGSTFKKGDWVQFVKPSLSGPMEVLDYDPKTAMVTVQMGGRTQQVPADMLKPSTSKGKSVQERSREKEEASRETEQFALQRARNEFGSGVKMKACRIKRGEWKGKPYSKSGWAVLDNGKVVGVVFIGSRAADTRKALRAAPATEQDVIFK